MAKKLSPRTKAKAVPRDPLRAAVINQAFSIIAHNSKQPDADRNRDLAALLLAARNAGIITRLMFSPRKKDDTPATDLFEMVTCDYKGFTYRIRRKDGSAVYYMRWKSDDIG